jgi:uncharacterized membrane protein YhaH (DUF805 family)
VSATLKDWLALFLSAKGRTSQKRYWIGLVILLILSVIFSLSEYGLIFWTMPCLAMLVCLAVKRARDIGETARFAVLKLGGALALLVLGIASSFAVLYAVFAQMENSDLFMAFAFFGMIIGGLVGPAYGIGFLLWLGTRPSDQAGELRVL